MREMVRKREGVRSSEKVGKGNYVTYFTTTHEITRVTHSLHYSTTLIDFSVGKV